MKQPWEWDEDDLMALIATGTKESIELDYKACDALAQTDGKKNEISKDVSAFANSAGGTIVYGMLENGHIPTKLDMGYDRLVISKEWLDQVINSRIQRRIDRVRINQVELTRTSPGKVAYVVYVPQSLRAPHQAADKRFYKRFNFESVPMEEYEIRDVSRRSEAPDLHINYQLSEDLSANNPSDQDPPVAARRQLMPLISNEAVTPAEYIVINLYIDARLKLLRGGSDLKQAGDEQLLVDGHQFPCLRLHMNHSVTGKMPIFQGTIFRLLDEPLSIEIPDIGQYVLGFRLASPRMTPKLGATFLVWDGTMAKITNG